MWFNDVTDVKYRYITARIIKSETEDEKKHIIVTQWETHIRPRAFSFTGWCYQAHFSKVNYFDNTLIN